jgi:fucose 4-O-acetylase-like acetyltransferase
MAAMGVLVLGLLAALLAVRTGLSVRWLYGSVPYQALKVTVLEGTAIRAVLYGTAVLLGVAILVLIPTRKLSWTWIGQFSLYPFVLHGFVIRGLVAAGLFRLIRGSELAPVAVVLGAIGLTALLSLPQVRHCVGWLVSPKPLWRA